MPESSQIIAMLMQRRKENKPTMPEARMDMTPMIDVVFLLIIFFMLVMEMSKIEVESVTLPLAQNAIEDKNPPKNRIVINVRAQPGNAVIHGSVWIAHKKFGPKRLHDFLQMAFHKSKDSEGLATVAVKIRGDSYVEWKYIQRVMVMCMRSFIWKCSFGVMPNKPSNI